MSPLPASNEPRIAKPAIQTTSHLSRVMPVEESPYTVSHKWRRHPQLREYHASLSDEVRRARHEAIRGVCAARAGALDVAVQHFALAAQCDQVELSAVPGFWELSRGQLRTAVEAYEQVGRYRDAAALDAHIATIFRPRLVGTMLQPVQPRRSHKQAAST